MTATDELRAMLDERGIKWWPSDDPRCEDVITHWQVGPFKWTAIEGEKDLWLNAGIAGHEPLTPEQAIAATLGAETCRYEPDYTGYTWWDVDDVEHYEEDSASDECWSASCNKCGYTMIVGDEGWFDGWDDAKEWTDDDGTKHHGILLEPRFEYCPNCGRKVTK